MHRVVHFEIHADDIDRAAKFYTEALGWRIEKYPPMDYWMVMTGDTNTPGIDGGMIKRNHKIDGESVIAYVCTIDTDDIEASLKKITDNKGTIVVPLNDVEGVGKMAYCKDTEGNIFGVIQMNQR